MRDAAGRFIQTTDPIVRFKKYCRFNPCTGCVEWIGARTSAQGKNAEYGYFWDGKRMVLAHRWSACNVHGLDISDPTTQVDHECRNTLCVQHVQVIPATLNRELQWIRIQVGLDPSRPGYEIDPDEMPFYIEPEWLK